MIERIRFFDLFSGIGGFNAAANSIKSEKYKFEHTGFCELDPQAKLLYKYMHNNKEVQYVRDAKEIVTSRNKVGVSLNEFDLLFAGFPCQSFSNVGYRKGLEDDRGKLFFEILDILDHYNPKYFILENVQKMRTIDSGNLVEEMKQGLSQIGRGYHVHDWDLLASDYGVPQNRRRIFFCGIRSDLCKKQDISKPPKVLLSKTKYPTTWHLLERENIDPRHYVPEKTRKTVLYKNPKWQGDVNIDNLIARPITATMAKWHRANQDNYFSNTFIYSEFSEKRPNVDINIEPIRRITPLEGFRIQGFSDEFAQAAKELKLSYSCQYRLIGNAVPVPLASAVIEYFLDSYLKEGN